MRDSLASRSSWSATRPAADLWLPRFPSARSGSAHRPVYFDAGPADLAPGTLRVVAVNGVSVLLAAADGEIYALQNQCGDSPLPLEFGTLDAAVLHCSWHGCRYDVRTGRRIDGDPGRLRVYPVSLDAGRIQVALDVEPLHRDR